MDAQPLADTSSANHLYQCRWRIRIAASEIEFESRRCGTGRTQSQTDARRTLAIGQRVRFLHYRTYASPQTAPAVATTWRIFAAWSAAVTWLPWSVLENPHCGDRHSLSSGT